MQEKLTAKQKIAQGLFELLAKYHYDTIQVKQICKAAKVSRMTYYRHFHTKDDIIRYIFDRDFTAFIQTIASKHSPTFNDIATAFFQLIKDHKTRMEIIVQNNLTMLLLERLKYYIGGLIDEKVLITREQSSKLLVSMIAGGLNEIIITWVKDDMKEPVESLVIFASKYMHFRT